MPSAGQNFCSQRIGCFISPHGFGHAARTAGVLEAIHQLKPNCCFEIFSSIPSWFFQESLTVSYTYHSIDTDVGLVQKSPFQVDLEQTIKSLNKFLPFDPSLVDNLSHLIAWQQCDLIICDIAPLGIAVARKTQIPSVLIENFTWDWIYAGYPSLSGRMEKHINYLGRLFDAVDHHIQTEPVCRPRAGALTVGPVCRKFRIPAAQIRQQLRVPDNAKIVLITTGGITEQYGFLDKLTRRPDVFFVIPGASRRPQYKQNLVLLPHHSDYYHPDLVNASDAVVGKVGYSTLAEVYTAGVPFGHISRANFRESVQLVAYIQKEMAGLPIDEDHFYNGSWLNRLPQLLELPRMQHSGPNGSEQIAKYIGKLLDNTDKNSIKLCKTVE